ncbi:MAG: thiamine-phosphate kinase, partial [Plesiomonas sp.]
LQLVGGDTTKGPLSLTLTVHGQVPYGKALTRSGASAGDWIYVTGTLGDSAAGLAILLNQLQLDKPEQAAVKHTLLARHLRPTPRILVGQALVGLASACVDLSDGLASDLRHILNRSTCGAKVELDKLPLSKELLAVVSPEQAVTWAISGGEDYELCFTVPEVNRGRLVSALANVGVSYTCIGQISGQVGKLEFTQNGQSVDISARGFDHFGESNA